jgi:hypothetical protein
MRSLYVSGVYQELAECESSTFKSSSGPESSTSTASSSKLFNDYDENLLNMKQVYRNSPSYTICKNSLKYKFKTVYFQILHNMLFVLLSLLPGNQTRGCL